MSPRLWSPATYLILVNPSVILGRAIKTEYLTLATLFTAGGITYSMTGGSKKQAPASSSGNTLAEKVKEAVPINVGSRCVLVFVFVLCMQRDADRVGACYTARKSNCT
jgi:ribose/xylose/arabinose/galactoside ABC-type transport system permease subunit